VLRIRVGFNADPDPACYLNADPDPACYLNADPDPDFYLNADSDLGSQTNSDPCGSGSGSWSDVAVTKSWILKTLCIAFFRLFAKKCDT
jgi:hypothetical protein